MSVATWERSQHARILYAYLSRLTPVALDNIMAAAKASHYASLNEGLFTQLNAQETEMVAIQTAVGNLSDHDRMMIEETIKRTLA